jgi:hypothetical protein
LRPREPYPILVVNGEQGSGKSVFCRMLRSLVDPRAAPIGTVPKNDRDLIVSAVNSWVLAFDNLSAIPEWLSDALCRLATGGGFATPMLHTDHDEMIFEGQRPVLFNGIPLLTDRADLADRAVTINLRAIPDHERQPEDVLWEAFERTRPRILGALLDAVSAAQWHISQVKLDRPPRMADFVKWVTAAKARTGLGRRELLNWAKTAPRALRLGGIRTAAGGGDAKLDEPGPSFQRRPVDGGHPVHGPTLITSTPARFSRASSAITSATLRMSGSQSNVGRLVAVI